MELGSRIDNPEGDLSQGLLLDKDKFNDYHRNHALEKDPSHSLPEAEASSSSLPSFYSVFSFLFVLHLFFIMALALTYGITALSHLSARYAQITSSNQIIYNSIIPNTANYFASGLVLITVVSAMAATLWLFILSRTSAYTLYVLIVSVVSVSLLLGTALIANDYTYSGFFLCVFSLAICALVYLFKHHIYFAAITLQIISRALLKSPSLIVFSILVSVCEMAYVLVWCVAVVGFASNSAVVDITTKIHSNTVSADLYGAYNQAVTIPYASCTSYEYAQTTSLSDTLTLSCTNQKTCHACVCTGLSSMVMGLTDDVYVLSDTHVCQTPKLRIVVLVCMLICLLWTFLVCDGVVGVVSVLGVRDWWRGSSAEGKGVNHVKRGVLGDFEQGSVAELGESQHTAKDSHDVDGFEVSNGVGSVGGEVWEGIQVCINRARHAPMGEMCTVAFLIALLRIARIFVWALRVFQKNTRKEGERGRNSVWSSMMGKVGVAQGSWNEAAPRCSEGSLAWISAILTYLDALLSRYHRLALTSFTLLPPPISFSEAGDKMYVLFQRNGCLPLLNPYPLPPLLDMCIFGLKLCIGVGVGVGGGGVYAHYIHSLPYAYTVMLSLLGGCVGYMVASLVLAPLEGGLCAVYVLYVLEKEELQKHHPRLFLRFSEAWTRLYPLPSSHAHYPVHPGKVSSSIHPTPAEHPPLFASSFLTPVAKWGSSGNWGKMGMGGGTGAVNAPTSATSAPPIVIRGSYDQLPTGEEDSTPSTVIPSFLTNFFPKKVGWGDMWSVGEGENVEKVDGVSMRERAKEDVDVQESLLL